MLVGTCDSYAMPPSVQHSSFLPSAEHIVSLESPIGQERLLRGFNLPYWRLQECYEPQLENYCGVASSVMALNALSLSDIQKQPYSQNSFFTDSVIHIKDPEIVSKRGFSFEELLQCLRTFPELDVHEIYGNEFESPDALARTLEFLMTAAHVYVIANFDRKTLGQSGGGHYSPVGAFDRESRSILILDVNKKFSPYWVDLDLFLASISQISGNVRPRPRGLIVCAAPNSFKG